MSKFTILLTMHEKKADDIIAEIGKLNKDKQTIVKQMEDINQEKIDQGSKLLTTMHEQYRAFCALSDEKILGLHALLKQFEEQIKKKQEELMVEKKQIKIFEKLKEREKAKLEQRLRKQEEKSMNEFAVQAWNRKNIESKNTL